MCHKTSSIQWPLPRLYLSRAFPWNDRLCWLLRIFCLYISSIFPPSASYWAVPNSLVLHPPQVNRHSPSPLLGVFSPSPISAVMDPRTWVRSHIRACSSNLWNRPAGISEFSFSKEGQLEAAFRSFVGLALTFMSESSISDGLVIQTYQCGVLNG